MARIQPRSELALQLLMQDHLGVVPHERPDLAVLGANLQVALAVQAIVADEAGQLMIGY
ncbi:hypothetical protein ACP3P8_23225 [Pseudomonas aeruginosa]